MEGAPSSNDYRPGFTGAMIDTANKAGGDLPQLMAENAIARFTEEARSHGLLVGLAGSLKLDDIPALLPHETDYLGFRGALCDGHQRGSRLSPAAISTVRAEIPPQVYASTAQALV